MNTNIHNLIKSEYEKRQKASIDELARRRSEIFLKIPMIQDMEDEMHCLGIKYSRMILSTGNTSDETIHELSAMMRRMVAEKERLLIREGYPVSYLDIAHQCPLCKDTGIVEEDDGPRRCFCYNQLLLNHLYNQSNVKLVEAENFSKFDESYYPDIVDELKYDVKKSPRENILGIKDKCMQFIENFSSPEEKNLYFCGSTGVGKTFMANCIAAELMSRGKTVLYQSASLLFDTISEYKMKAFRDDNFEISFYKNIFEAELLIIDDLGTESQSSARYGELLNILNTRYSNNLSRPCKTIISTNIEPEKLFERYTERVESRIIGNFAMYKFAGKDIRKIKRQKVK